MDIIRMEHAVRELLCAIGEDPDREGLADTPKRVAAMYAEVFAGLEKDPMTDIRVFSEHFSHELIMVKDIPVYSMCEHHLLPFFGKAHVAYIPAEDTVLGLSKVARVVDTLSRKPQLQERLCNEIADVIEKALPVSGVLTVIEAEHTCMTMRGIQKPGTKTVTIASRGIFKENEARRQEALMLLKKSE